MRVAERDIYPFSNIDQLAGTPLTHYNVRTCPASRVTALFFSSRLLFFFLLLSILPPLRFFSISGEGKERLARECALNSFLTVLNAFPGTLTQVSSHYRKTRGRRICFRTTRTPRTHSRYSRCVRRNKFSPKFSANSSRVSRRARALSPLRRVEKNPRRGAASFNFAEEIPSVLSLSIRISQDHPRSRRKVARLTAVARKGGTGKLSVKLGETGIALGAQTYVRPSTLTDGIRGRSEAPEREGYHRRSVRALCHARWGLRRREVAIPRSRDPRSTAVQRGSHPTAHPCSPRSLRSRSLSPFATT